MAKELTVKKKKAPAIPGFPNEFQEDIPAPAAEFRELQDELPRARVSRNPPIVLQQEPRRKDRRDSDKI